tara:strand:+ start:39 stop:1052 length:1014 start_codon:yes stop_codon:yes gene_type:complete
MSRIRADSIANKSGDGATDFPYGFTASKGTVTGILTAASYDIADLNVSAAATIGSACSITGAVVISDTTTTTSTTTGALIVSGGVGIAKSLFVGENLSVGGTITYEDVTNIDSVGIVTAQSGVHITGGGLTIIGVTTGLSVAGVLTAATSVTAGGIIQTTDTTESTTKDTGSMIMNGGLGVEKNLNVGTAVSMQASGISTFSKGLDLNGGGILQEQCYIRTNPWSSTSDFQVQYGMVQYNTGALAGTGNTLNVFSDVGINTSMQVGDAITVTGITSVSASTAYIHHLQVDHKAVEVAWTGGSAPTSGGSSGFDCYSFNIIKTGSATFVAIGNHVKTS